MPSNGFLSASLSDGTGTPSNRRRSASITPSLRSNKSRITLVENNPDLIAAHAAEADDGKNVVNYKIPKYSRWDHFLGVLGFNISKRKDLIVQEDFDQPEVLQEPQIDQGYSPWILPVYVLSTRRDTDKHRVPKEAKCTIDTGNMQGNIVSREFVENVLEFSAANFSELTTAEKTGGTGVTGHKLIPDGAIYLTWYHKKSTRVFHNMRFLISSNQHCDLIIGARSIQKDKLLAVPNLMVEGGNTIDSGKIFIKSQSDEDSKRTELYNIWHDAREKYVKNDAEMTKLDREGATKAKARQEKILTKCKEALLIAVLELDIYDWGYGKDRLGIDKKMMIEENYKQLEAIEGYDYEQSSLFRITGTKWKQD